MLLTLPCAAPGPRWWFLDRCSDRGDIREDSLGPRAQQDPCCQHPWSSVPLPAPLCRRSAWIPAGESPCRSSSPLPAPGQRSHRQSKPGKRGIAKSSIPSPFHKTDRGRASPAAGTDPALLWSILGSAGTARDAGDAHDAGPGPPAARRRLHPTASAAARMAAELQPLPRATGRAAGRGWDRPLEHPESRSRTRGRPPFERQMPRF